MGRPAYRFAGGDTTTVFADTGDVLEEIDATQARTDRRAVPESRPTSKMHLRDARSPNPTSGRSARPARCRCTSSPSTMTLGTEVYVSASTRRRHGADDPQRTQRSPGSARSRIGSISRHLRTNQPLWYQIVVWTLGHRLRAGAARPDPRRHAVSGGRGHDASRQRIRYPLFGLDALALCHWRRSSACSR